MHLYEQSSNNKMLLGLNSLNLKLISSHIVFIFLIQNPILDIMDV